MGSYLVRLKPLDKFYFGSTSHFGPDNQEYMLFSEKFPQQTSVLGMIRKQILKQEDLFKRYYKSEDEKNRVNDLIGEKSFNIESQKEQNFGKIKYLSPVVIEDEKEDEFYIPLPRDNKKDTANKEGEKSYQAFIDEGIEGVKILKSSLKNAKVFKEYDAKKGLAEALMRIKDKKIISYEQVYSSSEDVGIDTQKEEDAFFKKKRYQLKQGYSFAFVTEIESELEDDIVQVGDGRSLFYMEVKEVDDLNLFAELEKDGFANKILFLSDSLVELDLLDDYFGILDNRKFKSWQTATNDYKFKTNGDVYNLVKRGSILYCAGDKKQVAEKIKENKNLVNVGFNHIF